MKNIFKLSILFCLSIILFASCSKDDDGLNDEPIVQLDPPIILDCDFFLQDRVLTKNPNAAVDYIITCMMKSKGEIRIEPGVVIEFEQGHTGIFITEEDAPNSSFYAVGTSDRPIIFRGVENQKGYWTGLRFGSTNNRNELKHVIIEDAGNDRNPGENWAGGVYLATSAVLKMTNTTIKNCKNFGLNLRNKYNSITLSQNIYTENDVPVVFTTNYLNNLDSASSYSGNINNYVLMDTYGASDLFEPQNTTWRKLDVPYKLTGSEELRIKNDVTMETGIEVIANAKRSIIIRDVGSLKINGTSDNQVVFRGAEDVPAYWHGIYYFGSTSTKNQMTHVEIQNGGKSLTGPSNDPNGALRIRESFLVMDHITFTNCYDFAINLYYNHTGHTNNLTFSNLMLNNTPRLFADWSNEPITP